MIGERIVVVWRQGAGGGARVTGAVRLVSGWPGCERQLGAREDRDPDARMFAEHDLRHRRISLLHERGMSWARTGALVGQRNLAVTANTYTHVMVDGKELDYAALLAPA